MTTPPIVSLPPLPPLPPNAVADAPEPVAAVPGARVPGGVAALVTLLGVALVVMPMTAEPGRILPLAVLGLIAALITPATLGAAPGQWLAPAWRAALSRAGRDDREADADGDAGADTAVSDTGASGTAASGTAAEATAGAMTVPDWRAGLEWWTGWRERLSWGRSNGPRGPNGLRQPNGLRRPGAGRWTGPGTVTAGIAIVLCAVSRLNPNALAGEGLLLLVYLLLLDLPAGAAVRPWLRSRMAAVLTGLAAMGLVLAALDTNPTDSLGIVLGGLAATVVAYLIAAPRRRFRPAPLGVSLPGEPDPAARRWSWRRRPGGEPSAAPPPDPAAAGPATPDGRRAATGDGAPPGPTP